MSVMKGVILSICPDAQIVDITHEVPPFEISEGAFLIAEAYRFFPPKSVHVVVVDPGVGSARRPILIECEGHYLIGPDNGVLAMAYMRAKHKARALTNEKYFLPKVSRTFHGRDVFAPAAAHIAAGVRPTALGKVIDDHLRPAFLDPQRTAKRAWVGTILHIDRFGNLITNFHLDQFGDVKLRPFEVNVGTRQLTRLALTYAEVEEGEPFVILGSSGYYEIAVNQGSAAKLLGCGVGAPCELMVF